MDEVWDALPPLVRDVGSSDLANLALTQRQDNHCIQASLLLQDLRSSEDMLRSQLFTLMRVENLIRRCKSSQEEKRKQ
jgi:hypothetical protein